MGREANDPTVIHSSIALLQERFRQLQRVKEMREERELTLRVFAKVAERASPPPPAFHCEPPKWFIHPELILPSRPLQGYLSLRTFSNADFKHVEGPLLTEIWPDRANNEETEVDTSLHL
ncbi:hypothetical protein QJS10_CPA05g01032 [Acorus calamus]|uniref:Uncharacterized protein n=1 Tax=Acorus calamus TaxID=4465 RepID=A0AAV9EW86_ACOCL|nr:hypothetical protein QJS10_CPA05g01032 [Acorus calamus]